MSYKPTGIIHLTGEFDSGKTLAALGAYHPKETCYIFDDVKRPPIDDKSFGLFVDMVKDYGNLKVLELYSAMMDRIEKMPQFEAIIFDTWARTGKAVRYYAKANPYEFREKSTFAPNGTIRNMEQWGEAHLVEAAVISRLAQKCNALFLITHIKEKIIAGARSGLYEPDCGRSFDRVCNLRLWLRHNETSGVPVALVLKRISKPEITKDGLQVVNVLPRRLSPQDNETSIWETVNRFWQNPMGNREPEQGEKPTPFELSILDGVLTQDQKQVWRAELREKERQEKELEEFNNQNFELVKAKVSELSANHNGKPAPIVVKQIWPEIEKWMESENIEGYSIKEIGEMIQ